MHQILEDLRDDHLNFSKVLKLLEREIDDFELGRDPDYALLEDIMEYVSGYPDHYHHPREDLVYAKLRERDPSIADLVGNLEVEHESMAMLTLSLSHRLQEILLDSELPREPFLQAARRFINFFISHIVIEENRLFPAVESLLSAEDWRSVEQSIERIEDPMFGQRIADSFRNIRAEIDQLDASQSA